MIVILGRPQVTRPEPDSELVPGGMAADIATAIAAAGVAVELVGSIGDDPEGDRVIIELDRHGVGHAALLRDPSARTPAWGDSSERALPRLEAADIELGLRYVPQCRVLVLTDPMEATARSAALEAADYHGAAVVMVAAPGAVSADELSDTVTLLEAPQTEEDTAAPGGDRAEGADAAGPLVAFIADYAMRLDRDEPAESAFSDALGSGAWEPSPAGD